MGVNRFIDYANPMYWAKMLRKGGIPKRKPYSFTVKINDYVIGEGTYNNTVDCTFDGELQLEAKGEKVVTGIYDTSKQVPQLIWTFEAGTENYQGYSLSPASKWKITAKDGSVYEGVIGEGEKTIEGLFTLVSTLVYPPTTESVSEKNEQQPLYCKKFELTSIYDCVIFDGCTIEISPTFENLGHCTLTVSSKYGGGYEGLTGYEPKLWFEGKEGEQSVQISEWVLLPGEEPQFNDETIYIEDNKYMKLKNWGTESESLTPIKIDYTKNEGAGSTATKYAVPKETNDGKKYSVKIKFVATEPETEEEDYTVIAPKDKTAIKITALYKEDHDQYAEILLGSFEPDKGLVQINSSDIGSVERGVFLKGDKATLKAFPVGVNKFDGWYEYDEETTYGGLISKKNPFDVNVTEDMYGGTCTVVAKFVTPESTFVIRKKNYYDASITLDKQVKDPESGEMSWSNLCTNYYDWTSSLLEEGQELHKGDVLRITMAYGNGFKSPKLYIGNQTIDYIAPYEFMLDETTADAQYSLELEDNYGAVFLEVSPDTYKLSDFKVSAYIMQKGGTITDRYLAAEVPFTDTSKWTKIIDEESFWQTHAVDLTGDKEYFVGLEVTPAMSGQSETEPYLSRWKEAVESQIWGGAYKCVYNRTLNKESRYRLVRLSCYVYSEGEKNANNGIFTVVADKDGIGGFAAKSLLGYKDDAQTLLSIYEKNPKCVFDKTSDNLVILRKAEKEVIVGEAKYILDETGYTATSEPADLVDRISIDSSNHVRVIFKDTIKTAANPVVTLHLKYNQQAQTEEEFLKSNIAEAKEKLADAIEALEKDYDDGKEDVIEETPVKDEPDTDEADVAEAVLATEPTEDKE